MTSALHLELELRLLETSFCHPEPMKNTPACLCVCKWNVMDVIKSHWQSAETGHAGVRVAEGCMITLCVSIHATAYKVQYTVHLQRFHECALVLCLHPRVNVCTLSFYLSQRCVSLYGVRLCCCHSTSLTWTMLRTVWGKTENVKNKNVLLPFTKFLKLT